METEGTRVERLAALARIWGAVTYFHPGFPVAGVDWDAATVDAVDATRAATSRDDYAKAIARYLSVLGDPETRLFDREEQTDTTTAQAGASSSLAVEWTEERVGLVRFASFTEMGPAADAVVAKVIDELAGASAIVLDLRAATWTAEYMALPAFLGALVRQELPLSTTRRRRHVGFATERGATSGGYESQVTIAQPKVVGTATGTLADKRLAVVAGPEGSALSTATALHLAGRATVVLSGAASAFEQVPAGAVTAIELSDGLIAVVRTADVVNADGSAGVSADAIVDDAGTGVGFESAAVDAAVALLNGRRTPDANLRPKPLEIRAAEMASLPVEPACPTTGWRLVALYKHWNVIRLFFPYLDLCDAAWDDALEEFVPQFEGADTDLAYNMAVARLHSRIQDTHGFVSAPALRRHIGTHLPSVAVTEVEGRTVVTSVEGNDEVQVGDVVVSVDGRPVAERVADLTQFIAASTPQALARRVHNDLLGGEQGSEAALELLAEDGSTRQVTVVRDREFFTAPPRSTPVFGLLPEGVGYMDLARLTVAEVSEAFATLVDAPAIVFDMRGYPKGTFWAIAPHLAGRSVPAARFRRRDPSSPEKDTDTTTEFVQWSPPPPPGVRPYEGRVVVLIDGTAMSQAEHTCLFIEAAAPTTTFVGTPTNGANGDVTSFLLPGGVFCRFTGQSVAYVDGRQLQRKGVQPHVKVEPTIVGLRAGRDEILEAGLEVALGKRGG